MAVLFTLAFISQLINLQSVQNSLNLCKKLSGKSPKVVASVLHVNPRFKTVTLKIKRLNGVEVKSTVATAARVKKGLLEELSACKGIPGCIVSGRFRVKKVKTRAGSIKLTLDRAKSVDFMIKNRLLSIPDFVIHQLSKIPNDSAREFLEALTVGLKSYQFSNTQRKFREVGLSHLLSISGLHIGMIYLCFSLLVKSIYTSIAVVTKSHKDVAVITKCISFLATLLYSFAIVPKIPMLRALIMLFLLLLPVNLSFFKRTLIAALIILTIEPGALFGLSFHLSFASVIAVGLWLYSTQKVKKNYLQSSIEISLTVFCFVLPLTLAIFERAYPACIILNLIFIPFTFLVMLATLALPISTLPVEILAERYLGLIDIFYQFCTFHISVKQLGCAPYIVALCITVLILNLLLKGKVRRTHACKRT